MIDEFILQPHIYDAGGQGGTLLSLLEKYWFNNLQLGKGTIYILSGFGNYNGGVRFYDLFRQHISKGGKVCAIFGGSTSQRLTSKEVVKELLDCGAQVVVLNRKRIMHAKCYGYQNGDTQYLVVTSGNFTGPGMSQNVEAAMGVANDTLKRMGFKWHDLYSSFVSQSWEIYYPSLPMATSPEWELLYNEEYGKTTVIEEDEATTMLITLGHADTARINAKAGSKAALGSQYFWLSKDAFDFFPPLSIPNRRGIKPTYSTIIELRYTDLEITDPSARVTFESGNNVDFRLGTGALRYTNLAQSGDLAAISRRANAIYDLRIIKRNSYKLKELKKYLIHYIGHRGKQYGYIPNDVFDQIMSGGHVAKKLAA